MTLEGHQLEAGSQLLVTDAGERCGTPEALEARAHWAEATNPQQGLGTRFIVRHCI